mmetsp:Transcript_16096/g.25858  ORF Transcript_16096/g.25858 Transcript_16096/m.25858 type:complete len:334 (+) Transcript_16096:1817-2818(+)
MLVLHRELVLELLHFCSELGNHFVLLLHALAEGKLVLRRRHQPHVRVHLALVGWVRLQIRCGGLCTHACRRSGRCGLIGLWRPGRRGGLQLFSGFLGSCRLWWSLCFCAAGCRGGRSLGGCLGGLTGGCGLLSGLFGGLAGFGRAWGHVQEPLLGRGRGWHLQFHVRCGKGLGRRTRDYDLLAALAGVYHTLTRDGGRGHKCRFCKGLVDKERNHIERQLVPLEIRKGRLGPLSLRTVHCDEWIFIIHNLPAIPFNQICIVEWDGAGIGKHITLRPTVHRVLGRLNSRHRKTILPCPIASDQCNLGAAICGCDPQGLCKIQKCVGVVERRCSC